MDFAYSEEQRELNPGRKNAPPDRLLADLAEPEPIDDDSDQLVAEKNEDDRDCQHDPPPGAPRLNLVHPQLHEWWGNRVAWFAEHAALPRFEGGTLPHPSKRVPGEP